MDKWRGVIITGGGGGFFKPGFYGMLIFGRHSVTHLFSCQHFDLKGSTNCFRLEARTDAHSRKHAKNLNYTKTLLSLHKVITLIHMEYLICTVLLRSDI